MAKKTTEPPKKTVAIVGGGIAGLACANALKARGFDVTVIEESVYLGGKLGAHRERLLGVELTPAQCETADRLLDAGNLRSLEKLFGSDAVAARPADAGATPSNVATDAPMPKRAVAARMVSSAKKSSARSRAVPPSPAEADFAALLSQNARASSSDIPAGKRTLPGASGGGPILRHPLDRLRVALAYKLRPDGDDKTLVETAFDVQAMNAAPDASGPDAVGDPQAPELNPSPESAAARVLRTPDVELPLPDLQPQRQLRWWRLHNRARNNRFEIVVSKFDRPPNKTRYEITDNVYHEHCYHMFLGWYLNFWNLLSDVGVSRDDDFEYRDRLTHLFPGPEPLLARMRSLERSGSMSTSVENLMSGTASVPDLFLWMYSSVDMMGQQYDRQRYLDYISVNGFMSSRWYATEDSAKFHEYLLVKAFAVPTYFSSAPGYRKFLEYTAADCGRMLYVLKGNTYDNMFAKIADHLTSGEDAVDLQLGVRVTKVSLLKAGAKAGRFAPIGLNYMDSDIYRRVDGDGVLLHRKVAFDGEVIATESSDEEEPQASFDCVVLAVPPAALGKLLDDIRDAVPGLGAVRVLQSGSTAALDLYLKVKLADLPREHVVCRESKYGLTFIDNSQLWHGDANMKCDGKEITCLNVAATDFYKLEGMSKRAAMDAIIDDLRRYLDFDFDEVDWSKTYLQMNQNEPLFLNEVGSERWRPATNTEVPNLFLAGDFCDNPIGVVCVEGAVVSGLLAARAVQAYVRDMPDVALDSPMLKPIEILEPYAFPAVNAQLLKLALAPTAAVAKALSVAEDLVEAPQRVLTPRALKALGHDVLTAPGEIAADMLCTSVETWKWWLRAAYLGDDRTEH